MIPSKTKVILSGMQPSGILHLGNYIGAILNWKNMLTKYPDAIFYFMMVDLHSLTTLNNPVLLRQNILEAAKCYIASGIHPNDNITIFQQSKIPAHAELAWILSTITPMGWMERMTQFKDKSSSRDAERINLGLFTYPTLMAADILLYHTDIVPVGDDQKQHVELTRDIASRFNRIYNTTCLKEPEPVIMPESRIMSLTDGTKKMSKSDPNNASRILLTDTNEEIAHKISKAKTDAIQGIYYDAETRPEISNLIRIAAYLQNKANHDIEKYCANFNNKQFKDYLTEIIIAKISPIRANINAIDDHEAQKIIQYGSQNAKEYANKSIIEIKNLIGIC